ncbi:MAG: 23S rRNA (uracil(1939)-C(5))-methyltransferase RlmD [Prevotella sp.]|nr:23S rRNA (uracil(1939)-C(5))-methyltransferase RlmD [Prevotella sp.]
MRRKKPLPIYENVTITDVAAEGKSLARITIPAHDGTPESQLVVFVPWCVPGDVVDLQIRRKKHSFAEAEAIKFHKYSELRAVPKCQHFGVCGGCKWQNLPYGEQIRFKQQQVYDQLTRIGHLALPQPGTRSDADGMEFRNILGSENIFCYRNKLDFGCANKRYLTREEIALLPKQSGDGDVVESAKNAPAVGFHITGAFDKILPIEKCHLMDDLHNQIRNAIRDYATANGLTFFDLREQHGLLRDIIIRNSNSGEWMVILQFKFSEDAAADKAKAEQLLAFVAEKFPQITSLMYVDNQKCNDTFGDLTVNLFKGKDHIIEKMEDLQFKVGPKSFYQTNTEQAYHLYSVVRELAFMPQSDGSRAGEGSPKVYDLYTGTGTIANFVAHEASKVVGIEYVPEAIEDAKINSQINNIGNTEFFAGDMKDILTDDFIAAHGTPDIIITDPPRAGMHPDVVKTILNASPRRIVYVSCNPATQARDLAVLTEKYSIRVVQPVDMFPHTPHVENVVMLEKK